jgi:predicted tellurium resistance membrane protein TerC
VEVGLNGFLAFFDPSAIRAVFTQFNAEVHHSQFWVALTEIIWINVLLSGDNALVVALACRGLEPRQRLWGMILGAAAAVVLRIIFTAIVATVMEQPC